MNGTILTALLYGGIALYGGILLANRKRKEEVEDLETEVEELQEQIIFDNDLLTKKTRTIDRLENLAEYHKKNASFLRWNNARLRRKFGKVRFVQLDRAYKL